jgi:1,4-dihydroxy-6-naphthoate synthase
MDRQPIRIAHSPDADDRFMFWPLRSGALGNHPFDFEFVEADTQTLNNLASAGTFDIIAVSAAYYPYISNTYQPMRMGASVGAGYGPVLVTLDPLSESLGHSPVPASAFVGDDWLLLSPGPQTTAHNALAALGYQFGNHIAVSISPVNLVFQELAAWTKRRMLESKDNSSRVAALLIHEGRLIYEKQGARLLLDLGAAWQERWGRNLPLGINVIRRSLPQSQRQQLSDLLRASFAFASANRESFLGSAGSAGALDAAELDHYLELYANDTTYDIHPDDKAAFDHLLQVTSKEQQRSTGAQIQADWI